MVSPSTSVRSPLLSTPSTRPVVSLPTNAAYDRWSTVYDTNSNPLVALDELQLITLLPSFLSVLPRLPEANAVRIVDLGCGTGRNIVKLLHVPGARVVGLDASDKMLGVARSRCLDYLRSQPVETRAQEPLLEVFDMLDFAELPKDAQGAQGIMSTLVLEHVPLQTFFIVTHSLLVIGGCLLVTNMHPDMGALTQAGFTDPESGEKVRMVSYGHGIEDVVQGATQNGFEVVGEILERAIEDEMMNKLGKGSSKLIEVNCWFGIIFRRVT
ncbi:hypothetical protein MMC24_007089 [Lignoscripta atroalba]|nr:hypothetical protein [Lignoscripta atroalba]